MQEPGHGSSSPKRPLELPTSLPPAKRARYETSDDIQVKQEETLGASPSTNIFRLQLPKTPPKECSDRDSDFEEELDSESSSWSDSFRRYTPPKGKKTGAVRDSPEPIRPKRRREKTSQYVGVHWCTRNKKWKAKRTVDGKTINLGTFDDERAAAEASDACIRKHKVKDAKLNFPEEVIMFVEKIKKIDGDRCLVKWLNCDDGQDTWEPLHNLLETQAYREFTGQSIPNQQPPVNSNGKKMRYSKYVGVSWSVRDAKWTVARSIRNKKRYGGTFSSEIEAAKASDALVKKLHDPMAVVGGPKPKLNFPPTSSPPNPNLTKRGSSKYVGVHWDKRKNRWKVERKIDGKTVLGGHFATEEEAAIKADNIVRKLKGSEHGHNHQINFPSHQEQHTPNKPNYGEPPRGPLKKSNYVGVAWLNGVQKWRVERRLGGKSILGGKFDNEQEAARKSDEILTTYLRDTNRTQTNGTYNFNPPEGIEAPSLLNPKRSKRAKTAPKPEDFKNITINGIPQCKYVGVSWSQREQRWTARRRISGKYEYGGSFDDPEEAARAADRLVRDAGYPSGCKLNFPFDAGVLSDAEERGLIIGSQKPIKPANNSIFPAVKQEGDLGALRLKIKSLESSVETLQKQLETERKLHQLEIGRLGEKVEGRIRELKLQERICGFQEKELKRFEEKSEEQEKLIRELKLRPRIVD